MHEAVGTEPVGTGLLVAGITIFILAYAAIATDRIPKSAIALGGGALMILIGILNQEQAFHHVDLNVILLLVGMMILAGIVRKTGCFQALAILAARWTGGNGLRLMLALSLITAVLSAFLDNVTTVILIAPITVFVATRLHLNPVPFFIAEILASNVGGAATLIGDPPNILIASTGNLDFATFAAHMGPPSIIFLIVTMFYLRRVFASQLVTDPARAEALAALKPGDAITDRQGMYIGLSVLGLTIFGFLIHGALGWEPATVAIAGAALLMILTRPDAHEVFNEVEWASVLFFVGLFMMVAGLIELGVLNAVSDFAIELTQGNVAATAFLVLWLSAILSAVVDNIPYTATMLPVIQRLTAEGLNPDNILWWALAIGADLGGNATIIGASANVILAGIAEREGHKIGFMQFVRYGVPLTIVILILGTGWIWLRYLAFA
jgi:Na+/H+ antiporter NhaD/arsenite permease-like protein